MVGCRPCPGAVGSLGVVGVLTVGDRIESVLCEQLVADRGEEFVLAVEAPVRPVRLVGGAITFMGDYLDNFRADERGDVVSRPAFIGGEAGGYAEDRDDRVGAERSDRQGEQHRGVDSPGEGHSQPSDAGEQGGVLLVGWGCFDADGEHGGSFGLAVRSA